MKATRPPSVTATTQTMIRRRSSPRWSASDIRTKPLSVSSSSIAMSVPRRVVRGGREIDVGGRRPDIAGEVLAAPVGRGLDRRPGPRHVVVGVQRLANLVLEPGGHAL